MLSQQMFNINICLLYGDMVYENIITATYNLNAKYIIDAGGNGTVYKAELQNGQIFAVKKLHMPVDVEMGIFKSFISEIMY